MSNTTQRLLTAAVAVPIMYFIFLVGGIVYLLFFMALTLVGQIEYNKLLESKNLPNHKTQGVIFSLALALSAYAGYFYFTMAFTGVLLLILILDLRKVGSSETVISLGSTLLGIIYLGWLLSHALLLRNIYEFEAVKTYSENIQGLRDAVFFFDLLAFACTYLNDTGAYYTGRLIGRRKLNPVISPGKTVEGSIGGVFVCILTALVVNYLFSEPLNSEWAVAFGLVAGVASVFGKRSAGIKDSGVMVPGHGGVLDRFDSLIFVFPVFYYMALIYYLAKGVSL